MKADAPFQWIDLPALLKEIDSAAFVYDMVSGNFYKSQALKTLLPKSSFPKSIDTKEELASSVAGSFEKQEKVFSLFRDQIKKRQDVSGHLQRTIDNKTLIIDLKFIFFGQKELLFASFKDLSEIYEALNLLRRQEEKYRVVVENMNLGVLEVDNNDVIQEAYQKFCELSGYSREELIGRNAAELMLDEEDQEKINQQIKNRKEGESGTYEIRIKRKDGKKMWVMVSGTPIYNDNKEVIGSFGIHMDISKLKETELALIEESRKVKEAKKAKENLMARMSHEMRTPINGILGMLNLMEEDSSLANAHRHNLKTIRKSANNLLLLIEDLLDYAVFERGEVKLENQLFSLFEVVDSIHNHFKEKAQEKDIHLVIDFSNKLPSVLKGDPAKIGQVLKQVLSNAIKFSNSSTVKISVQKTDESADMVEATIGVRDFGEGIPKEELKNIFRGFYQIEQMKTLVPGIGIGLSLVKLIVDQMEGEISINSKQGEGTEVTIHLPLKKLPPSESTGRQNAKRPEEIKILAAEDNVINQMLLKEYLKRWEFKYEMAENGQEVLNLLNQNDYDIILMDVQMPVMDGMETARIIRNKMGDEHKDIPILALTAYANKEDREKCIEAGMDDYISKPFNPTQLFYKITGLVPVKSDKHHTSDSESSSRDIDIDQEIINPQNLDLFTRGDDQLKERILEQFFKETPENIQKLNAYWKEEKWQQLFELVHRMKPSASILGMVKVEPLIREINEDLRDQQDVAAASSKMESFLSHLKVAAGEMKKLKTLNSSKSE